MVTERTSYSFSSENRFPGLFPPCQRISGEVRALGRRNGPELSHEIVGEKADVFICLWCCSVMKDRQRQRDMTENWRDRKRQTRKKGGREGGKEKNF